MALLDAQDHAKHIRKCTPKAMRTAILRSKQRWNDENTRLIAHQLVERIMEINQTICDYADGKKVYVSDESCYGLSGEKLALQKTILMLIKYDESIQANDTRGYSCTYREGQIRNTMPIYPAH